MDAPSSSMRDLARRLLAASRSASDPHVHEAVVVIEKLRIILTKFAGAEGFASLLRRALKLTSADVEALQSVKIGTDGRLEGFEQIVADKAGSSFGESSRSSFPRRLPPPPGPRRRVSRRQFLWRLL